LILQLVVDGGHLQLHPIERDSKSGERIGDGGERGRPAAEVWTSGSETPVVGTVEVGASVNGGTTAAEVPVVAMKSGARRHPKDVATTLH
jgi:hypothetical protein